MGRIHSKFSAFSHSPKLVIYLLSAALVLHIGVLWAFFYADDFIQAAYFRGSPALQQAGLLNGIDSSSFLSTISNQFNFFDPQVGNDKGAYAFGTIPWWTNEHAMLHLFRPLSSITHWLDYQLWPDSPKLMFAHSLLVYVLMIWALYRLYRSFDLPLAVVAFAMLLWIVDFSLVKTVTWLAARNSLLAMCFSALTLYAYHRSMHSRLWHFLGVLFLVLGLLSAEAAIGAAGYLGAYMFVLDRRSWLRRIIHILPFVIVVVVWRLVYQGAGLGAEGVGQYISPVRSPEFFLLHAVQHYPILFWETFSGIDAIEAPFPNYVGNWLSIIGALGLAYMTVFVHRMAHRQPALWFWYLGCLFALVPGIALYTADSRVVLIPSIGAMVVLAYLVRSFFVERRDVYANAFQRFFAGLIANYVLIVPLFLSLLLTVAGNVLAVSVQKDASTIEWQYAYDREQSFAGKHIVVVNSPSPFYAMYAPFHFAYIGKELPRSVRILAPGFTDVKIARLDQLHYRVEPRHGFIFHNRGFVGGVADKLGSSASVYPAQRLLGFFHDGYYAFRPEQRFEFAEMTITVDEVENGRPLAIDVTMTPGLESDTLWLSWNWQTMKYDVFNLLPGETQVLKAAH